MVQYSYVKFILDVNLFICKDMNAIFLNWEYYKFTVFILANLWVLYLFPGDQMLSCVPGLICFNTNNLM